MGDQEMVQEVWLAHIQDPCIIGLDLLARWGAQIDVSRARLTIGAETIVLHTGLGGRARQNHCQTVAAPPSTAAARGSTKRSCEGLDDHQRQELKKLLDDNVRSCSGGNSEHLFGAPPELEIAGGAELDYYRRLTDRMIMVHEYTRQGV